MDSQRFNLLSILQQSNLLYNPLLLPSNPFLVSPFGYSSYFPTSNQNANILSLLSLQKNNLQLSLNQINKLAYDDVKQEEQISNFKIKNEENDPMKSNLNIKLNQDTKHFSQTQKERVKKLLLYIINNLGKVKDTDLIQERETYKDDPTLIKLFDVLVERYSSAFKTKDEILKYITRKAFSTIQSDFKKRSGSSECQTSETLCKRYFKTSMKEIEKLGININHRESFLQVLFPYRKNCKNKARYQGLISKLASSSEFYEDYCLFLNNFKDIMEIEKEKKVSVFVSFLADCVQRKNLDEITQYKRIPWLETWIQLANITAQEMSAALKVRVKEERMAKKQKGNDNVSQ